MQKIIDSIKAAVTFVKEVKIELKKVTWPSRKEVYGTTIVVLIAVFIFAGYLYIADIILSKAVNIIFKVFS